VEDLAALGLPALSHASSGLDLLKRPEVSYALLASLLPPAGPVRAAVGEQVEIEAKYDGYLRKQQSEVARVSRLEARLLPAGLDYGAMQGLRKEARERLAQFQPATLGQAARLSGVTAADVFAVMVAAEKHARG
jgi:tRNA uridine 5-carboxymethylaminomethyl modification enzyme